MQILIELGKDKQQCGENAKSSFWGKVFELQVGLGLGSGLGAGVVVLATGAHCANCCSLTSLALGVTMGV